MRIEVTVKNDKGQVLGEWYACYAPGAQRDLLSLSITTDIKNSFVTDSIDNTYHRIPDPPSYKLRKLFERADECWKAGNTAPILNTIEAIIQWIEEKEKLERWVRKGIGTRFPFRCLICSKILESTLDCASHGEGICG